MQNPRAMNNQIATAAANAGIPSAVVDHIMQSNSSFPKGGNPGGVGIGGVGAIGAGGVSGVGAAGGGVGVVGAAGGGVGGAGAAAGGQHYHTAMSAATA